MEKKSFQNNEFAVFQWDTGVERTSFIEFHSEIYYSRSQEWLMSRILMLTKENEKRFKLHIGRRYFCYFDRKGITRAQAHLIVIIILWMTSSFDSKPITKTVSESAEKRWFGLIVDHSFAELPIFFTHFAMCTIHGTVMKSLSSALCYNFIKYW